MQTQPPFGISTTRGSPTGSQEHEYYSPNMQATACEADHASCQPHFSRVHRRLISVRPIASLRDAYPVTLSHLHSARCNVISLRTPHVQLKPQRQIHTAAGDTVTSPTRHPMSFLFSAGWVYLVHGTNTMTTGPTCNSSSPKPRSPLIECATITGLQNVMCHIIGRRRKKQNNAWIGRFMTATGSAPSFHRRAKRPGGEVSAVIRSTGQSHIDPLDPTQEPHVSDHRRKR